jgi:hypothetical protein
MEFRKIGDRLLDILTQLKPKEISRRSPSPHYRQISLPRTHSGEIYSCFFGYLQVSETDDTPGHSTSTSTGSGERGNVNRAFVFIPPRWLSSTGMILQLHAERYRVLPSSGLRPIFINRDEFVMQALSTSNLQDLETAFNRQLVHPQDLVVLPSHCSCIHLHSLFEVSIRLKFEHIVLNFPVHVVHMGSETFG